MFEEEKNVGPYLETFSLFGPQKLTSAYMKLKKNALSTVITCYHGIIIASSIK
jgi:hypothetical protein